MVDVVCGPAAEGRHSKYPCVVRKANLTSASQENAKRTGIRRRPSPSGSAAAGLATAQSATSAKRANNWHSADSTNRLQSQYGHKSSRLPGKCRLVGQTRVVPERQSTATAEHRPSVGTAQQCPPMSPAARKRTVDRSRGGGTREGRKTVHVVLPFVSVLRGT